MEINLKKLAQQKEQLKYIQTVLANQQITKALSKKLNELIRFIDEIETDLEMCGESIIELDKPRLEAIEERNKMLNFLHDGDDI